MFNEMFVSSDMAKDIYLHLSVMVLKEIKNVISQLS